MMVGLTFMVNGIICLGILFDNKSEEAKVMVRVGKLNYEELLNRSDSKPMDFTGKPMRGFLFIGADGLDSADDLDFWVEKSFEFNRLLNQ